MVASYINFFVESTSDQSVAVLVAIGVVIVATIITLGMLLCGVTLLLKRKRKKDSMVRTILS